MNEVLESKLIFNFNLLPCIFTKRRLVLVQFLSCIYLHTQPVRVTAAKNSFSGKATTLQNERERERERVQRKTLNPDVASPQIQVWIQAHLKPK